MSIYQFDHYKDFIRDHFKKLPKGGYGQLYKIAQRIGVHTSYLSQVFRGPKHLTLEQASRLCDDLGLMELEEEYFLALVQLERAGNETLKKVIQRQILRMKKESQKIDKRLPKYTVLSEADKGTFYSEWYYSAISLLTGVPGFQSRESIAQHLRLPQKIVNSAVQFLIQVGLCVDQEGQLQEGTSRTHIPADSPLAGRHHVNWRLKTVERLNQLRADELAYTCPMTISAQDIADVRALILEAITKIDKKLATTKEEKLMCLNIDFVEI